MFDVIKTQQRAIKTAAKIMNIGKSIQSEDKLRAAFRHARFGWFFYCDRYYLTMDGITAYIFRKYDWMLNLPTAARMDDLFKIVDSAMDRALPAIPIEFDLHDSIEPIRKYANLDTGVYAWVKISTISSFGPDIRVKVSSPTSPIIIIDFNNEPIGVTMPIAHEKVVKA